LTIEHHEHEHISTDQPELNITTEFIKRSFNYHVKSSFQLNKEHVSSNVMVS